MAAFKAASSATKESLFSPYSPSINPPGQQSAKPIIRCLGNPSNGQCHFVWQESGVSAMAMKIYQAFNANFNGPLKPLDMFLVLLLNSWVFVSFVRFCGHAQTIQSAPLPRSLGQMPMSGGFVCFMPLFRLCWPSPKVIITWLS